MVANDKYHLKCRTQEGYYVETVMMMLLGSFNGTFKIGINETGVSFYNNNETMMAHVLMDGFDSIHVSKDFVGKELTVESTRKNHQLSNNKKDVATLIISKDEPNILVIKVRDLNNTAFMPIRYDIKEVMDETDRYEPPPLRHLNPTTAVTPDVMTKAIKVMAKSNSHGVIIQSQSKGIRLVTVGDDGALGIPMDVGKWRNNESAVHSIRVDRDSFKSIVKFYNLGKKLRIYADEGSFCQAIPILQGLGYGIIVFRDSPHAQATVKA